MDAEVRGYVRNLPKFAKPGRHCNQVTADEYVKWMMLPMRVWKQEWLALKQHIMWPPHLLNHLMPALKMMVEADRAYNGLMILDGTGRNLGYNDRAIAHALHDHVKEFMKFGHAHSKVEDKYG